MMSTVALCLAIMGPSESTSEPVDTATSPSADAAAVEESPVGPAEPDPELVERNRQLTARAQRGSRFQVAGRIVTIVGGVVAVVGLGLAVDASFDEESTVQGPLGIGLMAGGAVVALGGGGLMIWGFLETRSASRGELAVTPTGLRLRF